MIWIDLLFKCPYFLCHRASSLHRLFSNICQPMTSCLHELRTWDSSSFVCSLSGPFVDDRFCRFLLWLRSPSTTPIAALCLANCWWDWRHSRHLSRFVWYLQLRIWHYLFLQLPIGLCDTFNFESDTTSSFNCQFWATLTWQCVWNFFQAQRTMFCPLSYDLSTRNRETKCLLFQLSFSLCTPSIAVLPPRQIQHN